MSNFEALMPSLWINREDDRKDTFISMLSGILFFTGWWLLIDAATVHSPVFKTGYYFCGIFGTVSFLIVNSITNEMIDADNVGFYSSSCLSSRAATVFLFIGLVCGFASIIASFWIMIADFFHQNSTNIYPGVSIFLQNLLIFFASIIYKFCRTEELF